MRPRNAAAVDERLDHPALLRQARKHTIAHFHDDCYHARHGAAPKRGPDEEAQSVEARSLKLASGDDGTVYIGGYLDKVGGAAVRPALEPLAKRAGIGDDRPRDRRVADALVDLSMQALDNGLVPQRATCRSLPQWRLSSACRAPPGRTWSSRCRSRPSPGNESSATAARR